MNLRNPSKIGDEMTPGQDEPLICDGVRGVWFDLSDGIYIPFMAAEKPGNGDVGRMLDGLPNDRKVVISTVLNSTLQGMLERRGYILKTLTDETGDIYEAMVKEANPHP